MQKMGWFGAVRGHSRSSAMSPFDRAHTTSYSTLIETMRLSCYLSKVDDFDPPHLHLAPPQRVTPVEFRGDLWLQKTRVPGLSFSVVCVIQSLAVSVEHRLVTDRQTDRQTDGQTQGHGQYRGCIASRGKNYRIQVCLNYNSYLYIRFFLAICKCSFMFVYCGSVCLFAFLFCLAAFIEI